jgi:hypothetical protein
MKLNIGILASAMLCCSQLTLAVPMPHLNDYHALKEAVPPILSRSIKSSPPSAGSTLNKRSLFASPDAFSQRLSQAASKRAGVAGSDESPNHGKPIERGQAKQDILIGKREPNDVFPGRGRNQAGRMCGKQPCKSDEESHDEMMRKRNSAPVDTKGSELQLGAKLGCAKHHCKRDDTAQEAKDLEKREPSPWNVKDPRLTFGVLPGYRCAKPPCKRDDTSQEEEDLEKRESSPGSEKNTRFGGDLPGYRCVLPSCKRDDTTHQEEDLEKREPFHSGNLDDEPPKKKHHQHGSTTRPLMTRDIAADQGDSMEKRTPAPYSRYRDYTHPSGTASNLPGKSKPGHKVGHGRRSLAEDVKVASAETKESLTKRDPAPWTYRKDHESLINFYALKDKPQKEGHHPWGWKAGKLVPLKGHHATGGHHVRL